MYRVLFSVCNKNSKNYPFALPPESGVKLCAARKMLGSLCKRTPERFGCSPSRKPEVIGNAEKEENARRTAKKRMYIKGQKGSCLPACLPAMLFGLFCFFFPSGAQRILAAHMVISVRVQARATTFDRSRSSHSHPRSRPAICRVCTRVDALNKN